MGVMGGASASQTCRTISCNHSVPAPLVAKMGCGDRTKDMRPDAPACEVTSAWQRSL